MSNFKVGDRVETIKTDGKAVKGLKGTIRGVSPQYDGRNYGVEFDEKMGGHDLHSCVCSCPKCKNGHGWWVAAKNIRLLENRFEVGQIYRVGETSESGNIIKITKNEPYQLRPFCYETIRGAEKTSSRFGENSRFANSLTLLTGPQIGEAIRKYDAGHAEKKTEDFGEYTEVHRAAKVGEYIKAISNDGHRVPIGDIVRVIDVYKNGWVGVSATKYGRDRTVLRTEQYIVLEGYNPEQKQEHRKARVGDTIKILPHATFLCHGYKPGDTVFIDGKEETPGSDGFIWGCGAAFLTNEYVVISSGKHSYTDEQIEKAKKLCGEMMVDALESGYSSFNFNDEDGQSGETDLRLYGKRPVTLEAEAKCSDHDEYNVWIGRCVALCKALHKPVPSFIMGD